MNTRFLPAKLFFGLTLCISVASALFAHYLPPGPYYGPTYYLSSPGLVPARFAVVSAAFGLVYCVLEWKFRRAMNLAVTILHLVSFLLGVVVFAVTMWLWLRALLGGSYSEPPSPSPWGLRLYVMALSISVLAFVANILISKRRVPGKA